MLSGSGMRVLAGGTALAGPRMHVCTVSSGYGHNISLHPSTLLIPLGERMLLRCYPSGLGAAFHFFQRLALRPVPVSHPYNKGTFATLAVNRYCHRDAPSVTDR